MTYEARVTVHQRGNQKPDYNDIHRRMARAGYSRVVSVGGHLVHELHGMYRKASTGSIDTERSNIERALQSMGFGFSIELFHIDNTRTFNLEPALDYSAMLAGLSRRL
jgi:predicted urease superfamily metal-dependent hydrolase